MSASATDQARPTVEKKIKSRPYGVRNIPPRLDKAIRDTMLWGDLLSNILYNLSQNGGRLLTNEEMADFRCQVARWDASVHTLYPLIGKRK